MWTPGATMAGDGGVPALQALSLGLGLAAGAEVGY